MICGVCWALTVGISGLTTYPPDAGFDFFDYLVRFPYLHTQLFFTYPTYPWYYPAPAILVSYPFYRLAGIIGANAGYAVFILVGVGLYIGAVALLCKQFPKGQRGAVWFTALLSAYPVSFALQRGNIEGLTWTLVAVGVHAWASEQQELAAVLIGAAASVKIYPVLFAGIFMRKRPVKLLLITGLIFAGMTLVGLYVLWPHFATARIVLKGIQQWTLDYSLVQRGAAWDHSLFGLFKALSRTQLVRKRWLYAYYLVAGPAALFSYLVRARKLDLLGQVSFFSILAILLPPTSFDYTLCLLYVPTGMLIFLAVKEQMSRSQRWLLFGYAFAISPLFWARAPGPFTDLPGSLRAIVLTILLIVTLRLPPGERLGLVPVPVQA